MNYNIAIFVSMFIIGVFFYRVIFLFVSDRFKFHKSHTLSSKFNIRWHHAHTGTIWVFAGVMVFLLFEQVTTALVLLGFGLGLIIDLFVASLLLKNDRIAELDAYAKSNRATAYLAIGIGIFFLIAGIIL